MLSRLIGYFFLFINIIIAAWLGCCYAASIISPEHTKYLQLFSLSTPFAIAANMLFVIIWLFTLRKLRSLLSLIALCICYKAVFAVFAFNVAPGGNISAGNNKLKVMLWNVHGLGLFDAPDAGHVNRMFGLIHSEQPDILCMPEYYVMDTPDSTKPYTKRIMKEQGLPYSKFVCDNTLGTKILLGTAVFSKYPIIDYHVYQLSRYIFMMRCDIRLPQHRIISYYATHLCSFMLSDDDMNYIQTEQDKHTINSTQASRIKRYMRKFNRDYAERAREADKVAAILKTSPYPVLLCGDFNDLPASYTYTTIRGKMNDAFVDKGLGIGRTYNQLCPTLRIDHILYERTTFKAIAYSSRHTTLSDHNPVVVNFEVKE